MGRRKKVDRLHDDYPYLKDGLPNLVYDSGTNAYHCLYCERQGCVICFNSGYIFLDSAKHHNLVREIFEHEKGNP